MTQSNCSVCGRGPARANTVSHSKRHTLRRQKINIHMRSIDGGRVGICSRCLRTMAKV